MATKTELYRFSEQGSALLWFFTSGNEKVTHNAEEYVPTSISRTEAEVKNELARANIEVSLPLNNPAAIRWMRDNGEKIVSLTIFEREKNGAVNVVWKGRLASLLPGMTAITLKMESIFTSLRRPGLRARYQRSCRHPLYGRGCWVNPEAFASAASASAINGQSLTIAAAATKPDGYYVGGMLRAADGTLSYIVGHVGSSITLQRISYAITEEIAAGFPFDVTLYPGCPHTRDACSSKFNNLLNYGGFDFIPQKNPMGGSSIV